MKFADIALRNIGTLQDNLECFSFDFLTYFSAHKFSHWRMVTTLTPVISVNPIFAFGRRGGESFQKQKTLMAKNCCVCRDTKESSENRLFRCGGQGCGITVHQGLFVVMLQLVFECCVCRLFSLLKAFRVSILFPSRLKGLFSPISVDFIAFFCE